jgi:hypothetical protein
MEIECGPYRVPHQFVGRPLVAEADLCLGGVHVDVDPRGRDVQEQDAEGKPTRRDHVPEGCADRMGQPLVEDGPPIDETELPGPIAPRVGRQRHHSFDPHACRFSLEAPELFGDRRPEDSVDPGLEVERHGQVEDHAFVRLETESHSRVGQSETGQRLGDGPPFRGLGTHEFTTRGHVVEQVPNPREGPRVPGHRFPAIQRPTEQVDPPSDIFVDVAGAHAESAHRGDRGDRFSPESESTDRTQIPASGDLAGRMPLHGQGEFANGNSVAVVLDDDLLESAAPNRHPY